MSPPKPRCGVACVLHHHKNRQAAPKLLSHPDVGCSKQLPKPAGSFLSYQSRPNQSHQQLVKATHCHQKNDQTLNHESCPNLRLSNSNFEAPKKNNKSYVFPTSFFCFSPKRTTFVVSRSCAPVVDSFDLPHRCCPALEFLLGVSFPTKKREKFRMRTRLFICFFEKIVEDYEVPHFLYLNWQMEKCNELVGYMVFYP